MKHFITFISFLITVSMATSLMAETYYLTKTQPGGTYWGTTGYWSETGNPGAHSGADYLVDSGYNMRSQENTLAADVDVNVFPGDSLTLGGTRTGSLTQGKIVLKGNATFNNLTVIYGHIGNGKDLSNAVVAGNINIKGPMSFGATPSSNPDDTRSLNVTATITGDVATDATASITITSGAKGYIQLANANNSFSGPVTISDNSTLKLSGGTWSGVFTGGETSTLQITGTSPVKLTNTTNAFSGSLVVDKNAHLESSSNLSVKSATITYPSGVTRNGSNITGLTYLTATLPNATTTVSTTAMQTALKAAGIEMALDTSLTVTGSTREAATYYLNTDSLPQEAQSWNDVNVWRVGSETGSVSTVVPTLGDTVRVTNVFRTMSQYAGTGQTVYFLATTYLDAGGTLGVKPNIGLDYFPDLILNGGKISHYAGDSTQVHLGGHITVNEATGLVSTFTTNNAKRTLDIQSDISGTGALEVIGGGTVIFKGDNSGYTGTITVKNSTTLQASSTNALANAKIVTENGSKIKVSGSQKLGTWTAKYSDGQDTYASQLMPNSITVSDKYIQEALKIAGVDAPINAVITSDSTRTGKTYYLNATKAADPTVTSWNTKGIWFEDTSYTTTSSYIPTVGDVVYLRSAMRTPLTTDWNGSVHYFLAETHIQTGGSLALKNQNATVYIPNLILEGGSITNAIAGTNKLDGNIRVLADSTINPQSTRAVNILSDISGSANLTFSNKGTIILSGNNSGFSGKSTLATETTLQLNSQNALGSTGDLTTATGAKLVINVAQTLSKMTIAGTLNLSGSNVLKVPSISGTGITLNQTGGKLYVTGTNTTLDGNYKQTGGALRLDLNSTLTVTGDLALSNIEINSDDASLFKTDEVYPILYGPNVSTLDWTGISVTGLGELASQSLRGMVQNGVFYFGTTGAIANHVPEPATWVLLLLGIFGSAVIQRISAFTAFTSGKTARKRICR